MPRERSWLLAHTPMSPCLGHASMHARTTVVSVDDDGLT